jgi:hypothetical protein
MISKGLPSVCKRDLGLILVNWDLISDMSAIADNWVPVWNIQGKGFIFLRLPDV